MRTRFRNQRAKRPFAGGSSPLARLRARECASARDANRGVVPSFCGSAAERRLSRDLDGVYRFPVDRAARIALETTRAALDHHSQIERVTFVLFSDLVLFSDEHLRAFEAASA